MLRTKMWMMSDQQVAYNNIGRCWTKIVYNNVGCWTSMLYTAILDDVGPRECTTMLDVGPTCRIQQYWTKLDQQSVQQCWMMLDQYVAYNNIGRCWTNIAYNVQCWNNMLRTMSGQHVAHNARVHTFASFMTDV